MENCLVIDIDLITNKYDPKDYAVDYSHGLPIPWLTFDNFLPADLLSQVQKEIDEVPQHIWSEFTRNGSFMLECNNMKYCNVIRDLVLNLNSGEFLEWLQGITGIEKVIPDPHLIGAGLMRCYSGHSLKLHTDFNWNEQLHLNRSVSLILYISKTWNPDWGGDLEFWDFDKKECIHKVTPKSNRLLVWNYDHRAIHGHPTPITCPEDVSRDGLRMFYYKSNAAPTIPPRRSLYWFDETLGPYDRKENR